ncbi:MAG: hypothetical protein L6R37_004003 [Teloschistes peruensis]|nr:MAG: hypothetical protein L6R37_004003 [Teloschistes peruensis]
MHGKYSSFFLTGCLSLSALVAGDSPQYTSLNDLLSSTAIPPGVTNDLTIATSLYYAACPTSVPEISTAACFLQEPEMYSSLVSNIKSAGFWNPRIPSNYKATATDIASRWIHQPAVVAAVSSTADSTAVTAVKTSQPTFSQALPATLSSSYTSMTSTTSTKTPFTTSLPVPDVSSSTAPAQATRIPTISGVAPSTTVSQAPSPTQSISSTPMLTRSLNGFQRLSVTAQVFTILGPFIGATVAILLFVLTLRHQRRKKARIAGQNGRHGMPDSEVGVDGQQGAVNAMSYGNGNAVAGTRNKNRSDHHRGHRNNNYNLVYLGSTPEANHNAGGVIPPPFPMRYMGRRGRTDSGTLSSDSASVVTNVRDV